MASGKSLRSLSRYQCLRVEGRDSFVDFGVAVVQFRRLGLLSSIVFSEQRMRACMAPGRLCLQREELLDGVVDLLYVANETLGVDSAASPSADGHATGTAAW